MVTVLLQIPVPCLITVFALLSLHIGRQPRVPEPHRTAWRVTAIAFLPYAVVQVAQVLLATTAFFVGEGHPLYRAYLWMAPLGNHSRTLVAFAFYGVLYVLARRGVLSSRGVQLAGWATVGSMLLGALLGVMEGPLGAVRHFINTALIDMVAFAVMAGLLLYMIVRDTVDRDLWFCIALLGFASIFGVLYLTAMAYIGIDSRFPIDWQLHIIRIVLIGGVVALAAHRYRAARRGRPVPGMVPASRQAAMLA